MLSFFFIFITSNLWFERCFVMSSAPQKQQNNNSQPQRNNNNYNKTTKERERDKGGPFYQPYTLNNLSLSGSHGGVLRSQQQCFGKGETMGVGLPSGRAASGEAWDPFRKVRSRHRLFRFGLGDVFLFSNHVGCKKDESATPKRRGLLKFGDVFFWEVDDWKTSARCWLCNPIWYFVAASCLLARRTLCAVCWSVGSIQ